MAVTDNGWPALTKAPGPTFVAAGEGGAHDVASADLAVLFAYVVMRWHTEIEPVTACFGGRTVAENTAVNGAPFSNHISYTAIDVNGASHPYELRGGRWSSGFTPAGLAILRAILEQTEVLQWGGDFDSPYRDAMHVQVRQDFTNYRPSGPRPRVVSAADVAKAAAKVGAWVKRVQTSVGAVADGVAGPGFVDAVKAWQKTHGLIADGIFGAKSQDAAGWTSSKPAPAPSPAPVVVDEQHGNDVSNHQSVAQWQALHPQFLIAKSTEGLSWQDPSYATHITAARTAQLPGEQGAYIYIWPEYDPVACCTNFLAISGLKPGEWGVIDFEPYNSKSDPAGWAAWVCAFALEYRRRREQWPWLYLNDDMATRLLAHATPAQARTLRCLPLWKAAYAKTPGSLHGWARLTAWQYSGTGVDANWRYTAASPTPTRHPTTTAPTGGDDMPDTKHRSFSGTVKLDKGWNLVRIGSLDKAGKTALFTVAGGHAIVDSQLNLTLDGLKAGQTVQLRAREYAKAKDGRWHPVYSHGAIERRITVGSSFVDAHVIAVSLYAGRRLRWEVNVPAACTQTRSICDSLIWKD